MWSKVEIFRKLGTYRITTLSPNPSSWEFGKAPDVPRLIWISAEVLLRLKLSVCVEFSVGICPIETLIATSRELLESFIVLSIYASQKFWILLRTSLKVEPSFVILCICAQTHISWRIDFGIPMELAPPFLLQISDIRKRLTVEAGGLHAILLALADSLCIQGAWNPAGKDRASGHHEFAIVLHFAVIIFTAKLALIYRFDRCALFVVLGEADVVGFSLVYLLLLYVILVPVWWPVWVCSIIHESLVLHVSFVADPNGIFFAELCLHQMRKLLNCTATRIEILREPKLDDFTQNCAITAGKTDGLVAVEPILILLVVAIYHTCVSADAADDMAWANISQRVIGEEWAWWPSFSICSAIVVVSENRNVKHGQEYEEPRKGFCRQQEQRGPGAELPCHGCRLSK